MKLSELKRFDTALISEVDIKDPRLKARLADLGLKPGQKITCLNKSPLGGVTSFRLSHGVFALEDQIIHSVSLQSEAKP